MKVVIIHPDIYSSDQDKILIESFNSDVVAIKYDYDMTKEHLLTIIGDVSNVTHLAFLYHYPGYTCLPFFYDLPSNLSINATDALNATDAPNATDTPITDTPKPYKSIYNNFSDRVIDLIKTLKDGRLDDLKSTEFVLDILTCRLNSASYNKEVEEIQKDLDINIRFSLDKTGNPSHGANWIFESELPQLVTAKDIYFTDNVLNWTGILDTDITADIKSGVYSAFITWNSGNNTFTVVKDFIWGEIGAPSGAAFIELGQNEIFNGNSKTIDLASFVGWNGLFSIAVSVTNINDSPIIKNLGILNGSLYSSDAGFFIRTYQPYFRIENCYSTGSISGSNAGGIAGRGAGVFGSCTITNCVCNGEPIIGPTTGIVTITNTSTNLSDINNSLYGWDSLIWKNGDTVPTISNYKLPILIVFQNCPWINLAANPEYYTKATDPARFGCVISQVIQSDIQCCHHLIPCEKNPQTTNTDYQEINFKKTGKIIANDVDSVYYAINNNSRTFFVQPAFKTYRDYMAYLQSKYI